MMGLLLAITIVAIIIGLLNLITPDEYGGTFGDELYN